MTDNMLDLDGWEPITCLASEQVRPAADHVSSSLTDPEGTHGVAVVYTEWADANGTPVLRDYRPSRGTCTHYVPKVAPVVEPCPVCGHLCCDDAWRALPGHAAFLTPDECPSCKGLVGGNHG